MKLKEYLIRTQGYNASFFLKLRFHRVLNTEIWEPSVEPFFQAELFGNSPVRAFKVHWGVLCVGLLAEESGDYGKHIIFKTCMGMLCKRNSRLVRDFALKRD